MTETSALATIPQLLIIASSTFFKIATNLLSQKSIFIQMNLQFMDIVLIRILIKMALEKNEIEAGEVTKARSGAK